MANITATTQELPMSLTLTFASAYPFVVLVALTHYRIVGRLRVLLWATLALSPLVHGFDSVLRLLLLALTEEGGQWLPLLSQALQHLPLLIGLFLLGTRGRYTVGLEAQVELKLFGCLAVLTQRGPLSLIIAQAHPALVAAELSSWILSLTGIALVIFLQQDLLVVLQNRLVSTKAEIAALQRTANRSSSPSLPRRRSRGRSRSKGKSKVQLALPAANKSPLPRTQDILTSPRRGSAPVEHSKGPLKHLLKKESSLQKIFPRNSDTPTIVESSSGLSDKKPATSFHFPRNLPPNRITPANMINSIRDEKSMVKY
eukprot:TRINITY_DN2118_c0_g1_i1.p1 TRINITY_DN2118_c0_g1~~TRINITY_DN2118_c0_g1_i1.p1  ORF type:complete len:314 (+),score=41.61 TRINITY_DN2118_c0_g1_i1:200-1141(+)